MGTWGWGHSLHPLTIALEVGGPLDRTNSQSPGSAFWWPGFPSRGLHPCIYQISIKHCFILSS